jgi:hypothetical protein
MYKKHLLNKHKNLLSLLIILRLIIFRVRFFLHGELQIVFSLNLKSMIFDLMMEIMNENIEVKNMLKNTDDTIFMQQLIPWYI